MEAMRALEVPENKTATTPQGGRRLLMATFRKAAPRRSHALQLKRRTMMRGPKDSGIFEESISCVEMSLLFK